MDTGRVTDPRVPPAALSRGEGSQGGVEGSKTPRPEVPAFGENREKK